MPHHTTSVCTPCAVMRPVTTRHCPHAIGAHFHWLKTMCQPPWVSPCASVQGACPLAWVVPRVACSLQLCKTTTAPATTLNASSTVPVVATSLALSMRESAMGISLPLLLLLLLLLAVAALPLALLRRSNTSFVKDVYLMETTLSCHYPFASTALMPTASCFHCVDAHCFWMLHSAVHPR